MFRFSEKSFIKAINESNYKKVLYYIKKGVNVNCKDKNGSFCKSPGQ